MGEKTYTTIPYPNFSFSEFVNNKAKKFCEYPLSGVQFSVNHDMPLIEAEIYSLNKSEHKIQFITYLINIIIERVQKHIETCNRSGCRVEDEAKDMLYSLYGKLEDFGIDSDIESFSKEEIAHNYAVINEILYKLDEIKAGQEIVFDEIGTRIDDFKEDLIEAKGLMTVLGKRKWFKYLGGIVMENAASEIFKQQILPLI
jgi:hypothetical protein